MLKKIKTTSGVYKYEFRPLFPGIKRINKIIAKENLLLVKNILDKEELPFMLAYGTLLGAVREHDFIAHDEDIDLIVMKEYFDHFVALLFIFRTEGFEVVRYEKRGFLSLIRKGEYIDFYFYQDYPGEPTLRYCGQDLYFKEELNNLIDYDFLDTTFKAPKKYVKYLEFYYGENWRHPVIAFNYNLSSIGRVKEYTIQYIKALLPERLLEILQEKKDKKRMCQWIKKAHQFKL